MSRFSLRKRARVCYYEPEEPPFDEFIYCSECRDYVYEYCAIHGPLLVIPDDKVPAITGLPAFVPRAALTIPRVFLHIAYSRIPEAGLGVFSTLTLPSGVRFGPYCGARVASAGDSVYSWQIYDRNNKPLHVVDARDANNSNWMRYVNCSRRQAEQNLVAFQYQGQLYYRTVKVVPRFTELLVFYGSEFANRLGVDLRRYSAACPCPDCQSRLPNKRQLAIAKKRQTQNEPKKEKQIQDNVTKDIPIEPMKPVQELSTVQVETPINMDIYEMRPKRPEVKADNAASESPNLHCNECSKGFDIKSDLEKHVQTHLLFKNSKREGGRRKKIKCKKCSCTFDTKLLLLNHAESQHSLKYFTCSECEYVTDLKRLLQCHLRTHTRERPFKYGQCSAAFTDSGSLQTHQRTHTGEKPYKCGQCSAAFTQSGSLLTHQRTHTGEKPYRCDQCSAAFTQSSNLKRHQRTHTGEKPYKCGQCSAAFTRSSYLQTHQRTHTGEKPYKCGQCSAAFTDSGNWKTHQRTHTGEKPYKCGQCSAAFTQSSNLKTHQRTHTGEKPYKCGQCSAAFTQSGDFQRHQRTHTGEKPFECNICEHKTARSSDLQAHLMARHSGQRPHGCHSCSYRGATRKHLRQHMKHRHGVA